MRLSRKITFAALLSLASVFGATTAQAQDVFDGGRLAGSSSQIANLSSTPESQALPEIDKKVDLERYQGKWYQVAAIPQPYSLQCSNDTTAQYEVLDENTISVVNSCGTPFGPSVITGKAAVRSDASLKVTFGGVPFQTEGGEPNYRVTYLEDDYSLAVVGSPNRLSGFVLSRTPDLSPEDWTKVRNITEDRGWWSCAFVTVPAAGGKTNAAPLCTL